MTGLYPHVNGVTRLVQGPQADSLSLDPAVWTAAKGFREMGYATAAARKWHLSTAGATAHGFTHEFPQRDDYLARSLEFLRAHRGKPWFLYFLPHAHAPAVPQASGVSLPARRGRRNAAALSARHAASSRGLCALLGETSQMDTEVGALLQALEASRSLDNTIVAYCTDHGPSMHRAKFSLYEWGTHSALIFRGPGISGSGRVDDGLASTIDMAPTLISLTGGRGAANDPGA